MCLADDASDDTIRRQEEGSVEVDALEDEMEEDEPRPAHRSRSTLPLNFLSVGKYQDVWMRFLGEEVGGVFELI